jgi:hypothetical protein
MKLQVLLLVRDGLAAVREWEAEHGVLYSTRVTRNRRPLMRPA